MSYTWWLPLAAFVIFQLIVVVYRLYFHPLARFPGPKLAAASKWYEAYFDLRPHRQGTFFNELKRMHQVYGPVVRINPDEVHVDDSTWVDTLYVMPARGARNKHLPAAMMAGAPGSGFGTVLHDVHRKRRASMGPLFSKGAAAASANVIYDKMEVLLKNVGDQIKRDGCAEMRLNWLAFNLDALCDCFFDRGMDLLMDEGKARAWSETVGAVAESTPFAKQFTWFIPTAIKLPMWILERITPEISRLVKLRLDLLSQATEAAELYSRGETGACIQKTGIKHELYQTILSSPLLDAAEKEPGRISQEAFVVLVAGSETTARIMSTGCFHILQNKETVIPRLNTELAQIMPDIRDRPSVQELEKLPWLTAIIKESLRISAVLTSRSPVIAPNESLSYQGWTIPAGTPTSMTLREILLDPKIFEDPETFRPERWLPNNPDLERISRYFVPFGRGSRMCLGINTAMAMLYISFAAFFRRHDFILHDTVFERDIKIERDCFNGETSPESKGVRVTYTDTTQH